MGRRPKESPPPVESKPRDDLITQVRRYKLITPLFGGGVTPGEVDELTPISGKAIRGHLRFWWRATCGGRFGGSLTAMKQAEDQLWGTTSGAEGGPSRVQIVVTDWVPGRPFTVEVEDRKNRRMQKVRIDHQRSPYAYVAFPFQDKERAIVHEGVKFTLRITFPASHRRDVEAALWAWETFGGIGARTRRGFGALHLVSINGKPRSLPPPEQVQGLIIKRFRRYVEQGDNPESVPKLLQRLVVTEQVFDNPDAAWQFLIHKLKSFRQARHGKGYGLSKWPEANAIRRLAGQAVRGQSPALSAFPRAKFGLPIIFHFPHDRRLEDATLKGAEVERLASPLILRPLLCQDNKAVGLGVVLSGPQLPPGGLVLEGENQGLPAEVDADLTPDDARQIAPLRGETDVLLAFLNTLFEN